MVCLQSLPKKFPDMEFFLVRILLYTQIYNLSSVPQVIRFLLEDEIISSKTRKEKSFRVKHT